MNREHIDQLRVARDLHVQARRDIVERLAEPYSEGQTEQWRRSFLELQTVVEAIDRAIAQEEGRTLRL